MEPGRSSLRLSTERDYTLQEQCSQLEEAIRKVNYIVVSKLLRTNNPISEAHFFQVCKTFPEYVDEICAARPETLKLCLRNVQKEQMERDRTLCMQLHEKGAAFNQIGDDGLTLFQRACKEGMVSFVADMLQQITQQTTSGTIRSTRRSPRLQGAVSQSDAVKAKKKEISSLVHKKILSNGKTALFLAIESGNEELVHLLLQASLFADEKDSAGNRALHYAVIAGNQAILLEVLKCSTTVNVSNGNGTTPLLLAARLGRINAVKLLIDYGARSSHVDREGNNFLHAALRGNNPEVIALAIQQCDDMNLRNAEGMTPLIVAAVQENVDAVQALLDKGASIEVVDYDGSTIMHIAAASGNLEIMALAREAGCNINAQNRAGSSPLLMATTFERLEAVNWLIDQGALTDLRNKDGFDFIHVAIQTGNFSLVERALAQGCSIEEKDDFGRTPLLIAVFENRIDIARALIAKGAKTDVVDYRKNGMLHTASTLEMLQFALEYDRELDARNTEEQTPLLRVATKGNVSCVKLLLERGARFDVVDSQGFSFIHAAAYGGDVEIIEFALAQGCDIEAREGWGRTPLLVAASGGCRKAVEFLIEKGVKTDSVDEGQETFLHAAVGGKSRTIVMLAVQKGCALEARSQEGQTPLLFAARDGIDEIIDLLIELGADVNAVDNEGNTLLHVAAGGSIYVVKVALENDQHLEKRNRSGATPLFCAASEGCRDIVKYLIKQGANINTVDNRRNSLLHVAASNNRYELIPVLLKHNLPLEAENNAGETPLMAAVRTVVADEAADGAVTALLEAGASLCAKANTGNSPLVLASQQSELFALILPYIKAKDIPALHEQLERIDADVLSMLLDHVVESGEIEEGLTVRKLLFRHIRSVLPASVQTVVAACEDLDGFLRFVRSHPKEVQKHCTERETPLEWALIARDSQLAKAIFEQLTQKQCDEGIRLLLAKYPERIDEILNRFFVIEKRHLRIGNIRALSLPSIDEGKLQPPGDLLAFMENDTVRQRYTEQPLVIDGVLISYDVLRERVSLFLSRVANEVAFQGTPPQGTDALRYYYSMIKQALSSLIEKLKQQAADAMLDSTMLLTIYKELAYTSGYCGAPYLQTPLSLYKRFCAGVVDTYENRLYEALQKKRDLIVDALASSEDYVNAYQNVHAVAFIKKMIGYELQLSDAEIFENIDDVNVGVAFIEDTDVACREFKKSFYRSYSPSEVYSWIVGLCSDNEFMSAYIDWAKKELKSQLVDKSEYQEKKRGIRALEEKFLKNHYKVGVTQQEIDAVRKEIEDRAGNEYAPSQYWTPSFSVKSEFQGKISAALQDPETLQVKPIGIILMLQKLGVLSYAL